MNEISINPTPPLILNSDLFTFSGSFLYFSKTIFNYEDPVKENNLLSVRAITMILMEAV